MRCFLSSDAITKAGGGPLGHFGADGRSVEGGWRPIQFRVVDEDPHAKHSGPV